MTANDPIAVLLADLHAVAPARIEDGRILPWVLAAVVLALLVAGGMFLTARR